MSEVTVIENNSLAVQKDNSNPVQVLSMISNLVNRDNFAIHALEKLIHLQNDAEDRQAKRSFNLNLSEMSGEIPVIAKTGYNEFQRTKFAKLEDIVEITRPILHKHGFSITYKQTQEMLQGVKAEAGNIFCMMTIICVLKHRDGHEESNEILLPIATIKGQTAIQAMGMGATYGRRYTLMQALNIATSGDDNDGYSMNIKEESKKRPVSEAQLDKAIIKINSGEASANDLTSRYDLTPDQLLRLGRETKVEEVK